MKKILFIFIFLITIGSISFATDADLIESQKDSLGISAFIKEGQKYTKEAFPDMDMNELLNSTLKGEINNGEVFKGIFSLLGKEVKNALKLVGTILVIIVIHSIFKNISENLENKSVSRITYYVQYILIVTIIMTNFSEVITMVKESIDNLVGFMYTLTPILMTLMVTTGSIVSSNVVQPILLFAISFIGNMISLIILPLLLVGTALGIISNISEKVQIDRLAKYFKSSIVWFLGIALTIFIGLLSIEGTLSASVDGLTAKTTKAAVSNFIPVVGKILGDAVDTVIGCASLIKNAVGIVGIIIIIGICILPIIKLTIITLTYYLLSAVCEPIADGNIIKLLDQVGGTFKILLAILFSVSVMLIVGVTIVIKISNSGLMYR